LYIKSNPGANGKGIIEDITFENIVIEQALWWTLWVGPQQQNQPNDNSTGTGCNFLFPFIPICPTQPLVSINKITLKNVIAIDTLPLFESPGVILCSALNPCTNIVVNNVTNTIFKGDVKDVIAQLPVRLPGIVLPVVVEKHRPADWEFNYIVSSAYGVSTAPVEPKVCLSDVRCFWHA
jgi:hypothetical protein